MNHHYEGRRWAVLHIVGYGPNRSGMYYKSWDRESEQARLVDDRYAARTWATREAAERNANVLGPRYEVVEVYL